MCYQSTPYITLIINAQCTGALIWWLFDTALHVVMFNSWLFQLGHTFGCHNFGFSRWGACFTCVKLNIWNGSNWKHMSIGYMITMVFSLSLCEIKSMLIHVITTNLSSCFYVQFIWVNIWAILITTGSPMFQNWPCWIKWKFSYMFLVYMVITSENKKVIWKAVFNLFLKNTLFRHFYGHNADIW